MADVTLNEEAGKTSVEYKLPESKFTAPEGKRFVEWAIVNPNDTTKFDKTLKVGDAYTVKADVEFTAVWENIPVVAPEPEVKPEIENPKTGDDIVMYMISAVASVALMSTMVIKRKMEK